MDLGRAIRISPKQEFHGGDFNNTDILRVNLSVDYTVTMLPSTSPGEYLLELRARNDSIAYDVIKYWVRTSDFMPLRQEFYTRSGKLMRRVARAAYLGSDPGDLSALENPLAVEAIRRAAAGRESNTPTST